jgi:hypothetical protein
VWNTLHPWEESPLPLFLFYEHESQHADDCKARESVFHLCIFNIARPENLCKWCRLSVCCIDVWNLVVLLAPSWYIKVYTSRPSDTSTRDASHTKTNIVRCQRHKEVPATWNVFSCNRTACWRFWSVFVLTFFWRLREQKKKRTEGREKKKKEKNCEFRWSRGPF